MADFALWERSTIEQFAREATAKLVENKSSIDGLTHALKQIDDESRETCLATVRYFGSIARAAIAKHVQDAQKTAECDKC